MRNSYILLSNVIFITLLVVVRVLNSLTGQVLKRRPTSQSRKQEGTRLD